MIKQILLIFLLLIICITVLLFVSPFIDNIFYIDDMDKVSKYKTYIIILIHIFLIGVLIIFIHYFIIKKYLKYFKIHNNIEYIEILTDLVITLTLVGLQKNLLIKLRYLSSKHPIRSN
jgi:hypothetical protein